LKSSHRIGLPMALTSFTP